MEMCPSKGKPGGQVPEKQPHHITRQGVPVFSDIHYLLSGYPLRLLLQFQSGLSAWSLLAHTAAVCPGSSPWDWKAVGYFVVALLETRTANNPLPAARSLSSQLSSLSLLFTWLMTVTSNSIFNKCATKRERSKYKLHLTISSVTSKTIKK